MQRSLRCSLGAGLQPGGQVVGLTQVPIPCVLARHAALVVPEDLLQRAVAAQHLAVLEDHDAHAGAIKDGAQLVVRGGQLFRLLGQTLGGEFQPRGALGDELLQLLAVALKFALASLALRDIHPHPGHAVSPGEMQRAHRYPEVAHLALLGTAPVLELLAAIGDDALHARVHIGRGFLGLDVVQGHGAQFSAAVAQ